LVNISVVTETKQNGTTLQSTMRRREWTTNNTPHRPKHSTINLFSEHINVEPLNEILEEELAGSSLEYPNLVEFLFPDSLLGFSVDEATKHLSNLGAFKRPTAPLETSQHICGDQIELIFHDEVRRQVTSETAMADHLNHIITVLKYFYPTHTARAGGRKWSSGNCEKPLPGIHPRKPDLALCDATTPKSDKIVPSWSLVHSVVEIKSSKSKRVPSIILNTIRNKALMIFEAQPTRRYLITAWFTQVAFGLLYFDRSGEIKATWELGSNSTFVRLIAGLAFGQEDVLGYDPLVTCQNGEATDILVNGNQYHIVRCLFKAVVLRGRGTVCWLVEKDGEQFVIKDTWADVDRQWQEWEFLNKCKEHKIQNVPYLLDVENIITDSTRLCRNKIVGAVNVEERVHRRLVLQPICVTIDQFASKVELLCALVDQIKSEFYFQSNSRDY
jgi:hypothetical protein